MWNYTYEPVDSGTRSIRLFSLLPGNFDDQLHIKIWCDQLLPERAPEYEALSYVWGDSKRASSVQIKRSDSLTSRRFVILPSRIGITHNLDEALRYLRYKDTQRTLWVDAICIDQSNVSERSAQVRMMADIYRSASRVISWLGPGKDDSSFALQTLRDIAERGRIDENNVIRSISSHDSDESIEMQIRTKLHDKRVHTALETLFFRPYFLRLWIRQEIHLGKTRGLVVCGQDQLEWSLFGEGAYCWAQYGTANVLSHLIREICTNLELTLVELLEVGRRAQCSDPRDKIYAILGMLSAKERLTINTLVPDYSKPFADVYKEAFQAVMSVTGNIAILQSAGVPRGDNFRPTWSPDWSRSGSKMYAYGTRAHGGTKMEAEFPNDKLLQVDGRVAATVIKSFSSGIVLETPKSMSALAPIIRQILRSLAPEASELSETVISEFSYICTGGAIAESFDLTHKIRPSLEQIRELLHRCYWTGSYETKDSTQFEPSALVLDWIDATLKNRYVIVTDKGHIGLASPIVQPGDSVAAILGCDSLIVLTPAENGERRVLGDCYVHGLSWGEALLGPLPRDDTSCWSVQNGYLHARFRNTETGELSKFDPRIEWDKLEVDKQVLIDTGKKYQHKTTDENGKTTNYRQPDAAYLRAQGVPLETITLA